MTLDGRQQRPLSRSPHPLCRQRPAIPFLEKRSGEVRKRSRTARFRFDNRTTKSAGELAGDFNDAAKRIERGLKLFASDLRYSVIAAQSVQRGSSELHGVRDPGKRFRTDHRRRNHLPASAPQHNQMPGKISAVDRRYVFWLERMKITRVIPIEEMTAESLQPIHRAKRFFQSVDGRRDAEPAKISRGKRPREDRGPDLSARCGGPGPAGDPPENCPEEAYDPPP